MLPGPVLEETHRQTATENIGNELKRLAGLRPYDDPVTWAEVAKDLGVKVRPYIGPSDGSRGDLVFATRRDKWVIEINVSYTRKEQAEALVHELAHWFQRQAEPEWLCGEKIVYFYEGPVDDERHKIARRVERLVLG